MTALAASGWLVAGLACLFWVIESVSKSGAIDRLRTERDEARRQIHPATRGARHV